MTLTDELRALKPGEHYTEETADRVRWSTIRVIAGALTKDKETVNRYTVKKNGPLIEVWRLA